MQQVSTPTKEVSTLEVSSQNLNLKNKVSTSATEVSTPEVSGQRCKSRKWSIDTCYRNVNTWSQWTKIQIWEIKCRHLYRKCQHLRTVAKLFEDRWSSVDTCRPWVSTERRRLEVSTLENEVSTPEAQKVSIPNGQIFECWEVRILH